MDGTAVAYGFIHFDLFQDSGFSIFHFNIRFLNLYFTDVVGVQEVQDIPAEGKGSGHQDKNQGKSDYRGPRNDAFHLSFLRFCLQRALNGALKGFRRRLKAVFPVQFFHPSHLLFQQNA